MSNLTQNQLDVLRASALETSVALYQAKSFFVFAETLGVRDFSFTLSGFTSLAKACGKLDRNSFDPKKDRIALLLVGFIIYIAVNRINPLDDPELFPEQFADSAVAMYFSLPNKEQEN